jgi:hypothetical protein
MMTMTTDHTLQGYLDRTEDTEDYLGRVVMLSQREMHIAHPVLAAVLERHGLSAYLPGKPSDVDVFRRVTTGAARQRIPVREGVSQNLLVRQVADVETELVRRLIVEEVDEAGRRLSYSETIDVVFDKVRGTAIRRTAPNAYVVPQLASDVADEILATFSQLKGKVNGDGIRSIVNRVVTGCHAVRLRDTGGVYFVPRAHADPLDRLVAAGKELPGCQVDTIKLVDEGDGDQRRMIRDAAEADLSKECRMLMAGIGELTDGNNEIGKRRQATLSASFRQLSAKIAAHEELLEERLQQTRVEFGQLQHALFTAIGAAS